MVNLVSSARDPPAFEACIFLILSEYTATLFYLSLAAGSSPSGTGNLSNTADGSLMVDERNQSYIKNVHGGLWGYGGSSSFGGAEEVGVGRKVREGLPQDSGVLLEGRIISQLDTEQRWNHSTCCELRRAWRTRSEGREEVMKECCGCMDNGGGYVARHALCFGCSFGTVGAIVSEGGERSEAQRRYFLHNKYFHC